MRPTHGEHAQALALFRGSLRAIVAMAGVLIDVGLGWSSERNAQAAADTAVLAAGKSYATPPKDDAAAHAVAAVSGFTANYTDRGGTARTNGVTVAYPPAMDDFAGELGYVQVTVKGPMQTTSDQPTLGHAAARR